MGSVSLFVSKHLGYENDMVLSRQMSELSNIRSLKMVLDYLIYSIIEALEVQNSQ